MINLVKQAIEAFQAWRRRQAELAQEWGLIQQELARQREQGD